MTKKKQLPRWKNLFPENRERDTGKKIKDEKETVVYF